MALICVAITDSPTAHHGSERFAEEVAVDLVGALRAAQAVDDDPAEVGDDDDPVERAHHANSLPKHAQRSDDDDLEDEDADVGRRSSACRSRGVSTFGRSRFGEFTDAALRSRERLLGARQRVGRAGPPRLVGVELRARRLGRARAVSSGAGPP